MTELLYLQSSAALGQEQLVRLLGTGLSGACGFGVGHFPERGAEPAVERWSEPDPERVANYVLDLPDTRPLLVERDLERGSREEREELGPFQCRDRELGMVLLAHSGELPQPEAELPGEEFASTTRRVIDLLESGETGFLEMIEDFSDYGLLAVLTGDDRFIWRRDPEAADAPHGLPLREGAVAGDGMRFRVLVSGFEGSAEWLDLE